MKKTYRPSIRPDLPKRATVFPLPLFPTTQEQEQFMTMDASTNGNFQDRAPCSTNNCVP